MSTQLADVLAAAHSGKSVVMGILNVTPDSFSDGGQFLDAQAAATRARQMVDEGAAIIDIGAESTRPGSRRIGADEQIARLADVVPAAVATGAVVSVDTTLATVARFALDAGAAIINDISAGRDDLDLLPLVADRDAAIVLMHMQGTPATMQAAPTYRDVVAEVRKFLAQRLDAAVGAGVARQRCIIDPGLGFGKRLEHNLALLAGAGQLTGLGAPLLIGASRKRSIGEITGRDDPARRVFGSIAAALAARARGATIFRVHDVAATVDAMAVFDAVAAGGR
jgi:dihydropteroate synthase